MKKRILAVLLGLVLLLTACSETSPNESSGANIEDENTSVGDSGENESDPTPVQDFVQSMRDMFSQNGFDMYAAALGWDATTYSTKVIINKELSVVLYSMEKDAEITEVAVITKLPETQDELIAFIAASGAAICTFDPEAEFSAACDLATLLLDDMVQNNLPWSETTIGNVYCDLSHLGSELMFGISYSDSVS